MRKFNYIPKILIILLYFLNAQLFGQTNITIGTGLGSSDLPLISWVPYSYTQTIYPSSLLTSSGLQPGMVIKSISWYVSSADPSNVSGGWNVYLGNTIQSGFSSTTNWIPITSLTQVFSGTVIPYPIGWKTINLTTPFTYNGDNLVITVDDNTPSFYGNNPTVSFQGTTSNPAISNSILKSSNFDIDPSLPGTANVTQFYYPNIQLGIGCWGNPNNASISLNPTTGCPGNLININANGASNNLGISYQWQSSPDAINWTNVGTNASSYSALPTSSLYYQMITTCSYSGSSVASNQVLYTANPVPAASITASGPTSFCIGSSVNLTAESGIGLTYQWKNNGANISGATSQTYNTISSGNYTVVVTNSNGCSSTSNTIDVTVNASVAGSVSGNQTLCSGISPANITLTGNTGSIQWQVSMDNITFNNITGATASPLTSAQMGSLTATRYYRAVVTSGVCPSVNSSVVTVTVSPTSQAGTVSGNQTICSGTSPANITLTGNTGTIQWQVSTDNITFNNITGATASPLTSAQMGSLTATRYYRAVVKSGVCNSVNSSVVTVTVNPSSVAGTVSGNQTICTGTSPANITLTGNTGTIQWQVSTDNITFNNITGATASPLTFAQMGSLTATRYYRAVVTSGVCPSVNSSVVTVTVNPFPAMTSSNISSSCSGVAVNFPLTSNVIGSTFSWIATDNSQISGESLSAALSSTITDVLFNNTSGPLTVLYTVTPSYTAGGVTCTGASQTVTITVNILPTASITVSGPTTFCIGSSVTLTANSGTGFTYQWKNNGVNISGATLQSYSATSSGNYTVVVTNSNGCSATSSATVVTVNSNTIALSSAVGTNNQTRCINTAITNITYSTTGATGATVTGLPTGVTGSWATNVFTISGTPSATGTFNYTITMTGGCTGGTNTATGTIIVTPPPTITDMTNTSCSGDTFSLIPVNSTNGVVPAGTIYSWSAPVVTGGITGFTTGTGVTSIMGTLTHSINTAQTAIYTVTPALGTCIGTTFTVTLTVNPKPSITTMTYTVCSGETFSSIPINLTNGVVPAGTTYSWLAPLVNGGINGGTSGSGATSIMGTLTNSTNNVQTATYTITPSTNTCLGANFILTVKVNANTTIFASDTSICLGESVTLSLGGNLSDTLIFPGNSSIPIIGSSFEYSNSAYAGWAINSGGWNIGHLPFIGTGTGAVSNSTFWPLGTTYYLRKQIDLTFYNLNTINWKIAVDNGFTLYVNGQQIASANEGGPAIEWEYSGIIPINYLIQGINNIAIAISDDGAGAAAFNMLLKGIPINPIIQWSTNESNNSINVSPLQTSTYSVTITNSLGMCNDSLEIEVLPNNSISLASPPFTTNQHICINTPIDTIKYSTFGATGATATGLPPGVLGSWTSNEFTISGTPSAAGTFNYTVTMTGGCAGGVNSVNDTIIVNSPIVSNTAGSPTTFCEGSSVLLIANTGTGFTYQWLLNNSPISGQNNSTYVASSSGNYAVSITNSLNCTNTSNIIQVTVNTNPALPIISFATPTTFCQGDSVVLNVANNPLLNYQWQNNGINLLNATSNQLTVYNSGNYTVVATNSNNCSTGSSIETVNVNPLPSSDISALSTTTFCEGDSVVLQGDYIVNGIYNWSNQNGIIANSDSSSLTVFNSGSYAYQIIDSNTCTNQSDTIEVIVNTHNPSEIYTTSLGPFSLNGSTYSESGIYIQNLQTVNGCDSVLTLHLEIENVSLEDLNDECSFLIYPNPSKDNLVYFKKSEECEIEIESIYDMYGRQIAFIQDEYKVQLFTEARGVYYLMLNQNKIIKRYKFIID